MISKTNKNPLVSFIIINWKSENVTAECVDSIRQLATRHPYEIIIFDNESTTESLANLKELRAQVLGSPVNLGFGVANNLAAEAAQGDYLALVNNDCIVASDWLDVAIATIRREKAGIVGGIELAWGKEKDSNKPALYSVPQIKPSNLLIQQSTDNVPSQQVAYVTASNVLMRRTLFKEIGGFDDIFFLYYEDLDLCARFIETGSTIYFCNALKVQHRVNYSSDRNQKLKYFLIFRNRYKIAAKYYPNKSWLQFVLKNALIDAVRSPLLMVIGYLGSLFVPHWANKVITHYSRTKAAWWAVSHLAALRIVRKKHRQNGQNNAIFYNVMINFAAKHANSGK